MDYLRDLKWHMNGGQEDGDEVAKEDGELTIQCIFIDKNPYNKLLFSIACN